jgi:hypothetical protein
VELWAELRREHFVRGVSIKELMRRTGFARNTIRTAVTRLCVTRVCGGLRRLDEAASQAAGALACVTALALLPGRLLCRGGHQAGSRGVAPQGSRACEPRA